MNPRLVLLQETLEVPPVEKLQRAFRSVRTLVASDAWTLANDAYGILVKNLAPADAIALQAALEAEGIRTVAVAESELPTLPAVKFVRQLDCLPAALFVYDPIGRRIPVPWAQVLLVAAGVVQHFELHPAGSRRPSGVKDVRPGDLDRIWGLGSHPLPTAQRDEDEGTLVLEIVLARAAMRFQTQADKLRCNYLEGRATPDPGRNLGLVVGNIARLAPHVRFNRGAEALRAEPPGLLVYPSKNAFYEEVLWTLWRLGRAAGN